MREGRRWTDDAFATWWPGQRRPGSPATRPGPGAWGLGPAQGWVPGRPEQTEEKWARGCWDRAREERGRGRGALPLRVLLTRLLGRQQQAEHNPGACAAHGRWRLPGRPPRTRRLRPWRAHKTPCAPPTHARGRGAAQVCAAGGVLKHLTAITVQPDSTISFPKELLTATGHC